MKKLSNATGFTLIELMITLVILGILVTVAAPSMEDTIKKSSVRGHHRDFSAAMAFARGEALSRGKNITMCPSADAATCDTTNNNWTNGWIVYEEDGQVNGFDAAADTLLRVYEYEGSNTAKALDPSASPATAINSLSWNHRGFSVDSRRALIVICARGNEDKYARGLLMASSGRAVSTRDTNNDQIHETVFEIYNSTTNKTEKVEGALKCP